MVFQWHFCLFLIAIDVLSILHNVNVLYLKLIIIINIFSLNQCFNAHNDEKQTPHSTKQDPQLEATVEFLHNTQITTICEDFQGRCPENFTAGGWKFLLAQWKISWKFSKNVADNFISPLGKFSLNIHWIWKEIWGEAKTTSSFFFWGGEGG